MRRLGYIVIILLLTLVFFISPACAETKSEAEPIVEEKPNPIDEKEIVNDEEQGLEVDKGILSVEITVPASMFEGEENEIINETEEDGIEITLNDDGSVTYRMSKLKYNALMGELDASMIESIEEIENDDNFESIKKISYNNKFSKFTVEVDREIFENSFDGFVALGIGIISMYYQVFSGVNPEDYKTTIIFKDIDTGEELNSVVFPDDFEESDDN